LWCNEKKTDIILNYINENTQEFIKNKVFIFNTKNRIKAKYNINKTNNNNNLNYNVNELVINKSNQNNNLNYYVNESVINESKQNNNLNYIMNTSYNTITFENYKIIVIIDNDEIIWFNAKQICKSLEYKNTKKTTSYIIKKKNKIQLKNMNINFNIKQQPDSIYINESGLYSLLIKSRNKKAEKFDDWLTSDVLPNLKQQNIFSSDEDITKLLKKINDLKAKNKLLQNDLKLEKFHEGEIIYVIEETDIDGETYYRIGKTDNMNKRIQIHNTHSIHNKKVVHYVELACPLQLETCLRSMLYKYRYKNKKDYFSCSLNKIKKAFTKCVNSIKCVESDQTGGTYKITYFEDKLNNIYDSINISTIN
jgi:prophage antirepressor-like protein